VIKGRRLRLDLLTKIRDEYVVIELKCDEATRDTLVHQLRPYMNGIKKRLGLTTLRGVMIARDQSPDLERELKKTENKDIGFVSYKFSVNISL